MCTLVYHAGSVLDNVNTSLLCELIGVIDPCIIRPVSGSWLRCADLPRPRIEVRGSFQARGARIFRAREWRLNSCYAHSYVRGRASD